MSRDEADLDVRTPNEHILDTLPVAVTAMDRTGKLVYANQAATVLYGYAKDDLIGRDAFDLVLAPADVPAATEIVEFILAGKTWEGRFPVRRPDGSTLVGAFVAAPLLAVDGELAGVISVGRDVTSTWLAEEERSALLLGEQNARREAEELSQRLAATLAAESEARTQAEEAATRLQAFQAVLTHLGGALTVEAVADAVVTHGGAGLGADALIVYLVDDEGTALVEVASQGMDPQTMAEYARIPLDVSLPASDSFRSGEPDFIESVEERDRRWPALARHRTGDHAYALHPLVIAGRPIGMLVVVYGHSRQFDESDRSFVGALARQCAQAIDRARLFEAERRANDRRAFLLEVSRVLASSMELERTVTDVARLLVPVVADAATVYLLDEEGLRFVSAHHVDDELRAVLEELALRGGPYATSALLLEGIANQEPLFFSDVPDSLLEQEADDEAHLALMRRLGVRSGMAVPLVARGRTVGVLALSHGPSGRHFDHSDLAFIVDLAERIAVALDNAALLHERTEIASTLQRSLAPPHLPTVPGLDLGAVYNPGGESVEVGGDFYDVFPTGEHEWTVVMGDVCGRGSEAASLTALVRYTVRAVVLHERRPASVLQLVNERILTDRADRQDRDVDADPRFVTAVYGRLHVNGDRVNVQTACAGHPAPLVAGPDGVEVLECEGTLLGIEPTIEVAEHERELQPGEAVVLYTDGIIEARGDDGLFGEDRLIEVVAANRHAPAAVLARAVESAVLAWTGGSTRDDLAVLVLRRPTG